MKILQSKKITKDDLNKGERIQLRSDAKLLLGFNIINPNNNIVLYNSLFSLNIDDEQYIPNGTVVAIAQTSSSVPPDERFLSLFGNIELTDRIAFIKADLQAGADALIFNFLFEK